MTAPSSPANTPPQTAPVKLFATIFGVFLLVMGLLIAAFTAAFFYFTQQADAQTARFEKEGRDASAVVVRKWKQTGASSATGSGTSRRTSSGSTNYFLAVKYEPEPGKTRESVAMVNSISLWSAAREGGKVDVRYLEALPEFVMVKKDDPDEPMEAEEWAILIGAAVVFLLMAAGCFWVRQRFGHFELKLNQRSSRYD